MDLITGLPIFTNWKGKTYNSILVIVNQITKIVYYEPVKVSINAPGLAEVILVVVIRQYDLADSIVSNDSSIFNAKL